ncbi:hypothetical protein [Mycobacteroides chelonae]
MTECFVRGCKAASDPVIDLDPQKLGGYSYEVALCQPHADAIVAGSVWVCRNKDDARSGGWEVLMGDGIALLGEYALAGTEISTGSVHTLASEGLIPDGWLVSLHLKRIGDEQSVTVPIRLTLEKLRELHTDLGNLLAAAS